MKGKNQYIKVKSLKNQALIAEKCSVADSYFVRLRGLIGKSGLDEGSGMFFPSCKSIHMWFMRFSIDVVFLRFKKENIWTVSSVFENVRPWKIHPLVDWHASGVLELPAGNSEKCQISVGDEICIS